METWNSFYALLWALPKTNILQWSEEKRICMYIYIYIYKENIKKKRESILIYKHNKKKKKYIYNIHTHTYMAYIDLHLDNLQD